MNELVLLKIAEDRRMVRANCTENDKERRGMRRTLFGEARDLEVLNLIIIVNVICKRYAADLNFCKICGRINIGF